MGENITKLTQGSSRMSILNPSGNKTNSFNAFKVSTPKV